MPFFRPILANCHSSSSSCLRRLHDVVAVLAVGEVRAVGAAALHELGRRLGRARPGSRSPKMHCQCESRNVTSICQRRPSSTGSSNDDPLARGTGAVGCCASPIRSRAYATAVGSLVSIADDARAPRRSAVGARRRPGARRAARARALRARRRRRPRARRRPCASPRRGARSPPRCGSRARHDRPFVARGSGTGLAGGATPVDDPLVIVTTQLNRVLEVDAERAVRVGRARRAQPRPQPGGRATSACTTRPTRRRSRRAPSAATSPPTPAGRTASRRASPPPTCSRSRSCCADGSVTRARRARARRARLRPARAASSAARARWASPPGSRCGSRPNPPVGPHAAARLHVDRGRRAPR